MTGSGLEGVEVRPLVVHPDDRGFFCELYRNDWNTFFREPVVQVNLSSSFPGIVRAWHRHARGQIDYFIVVQGCLKVCAYNAETRALQEIVASDRVLSVVRVPGHYYHGTMALGTVPVVMVYATTRLYDYPDPDEERLVWNDPSIVPTSVNGLVADVRTGVPWNWLDPPHR